MKKIILYLNILMSLLITACSNDDITVPTPPTGADGKTCEVSFWASIPETSSASRGALGEATDTSVETLSLLVFDAESGLYLYESKATLSDQKLENGIHKGKYKAQLQLSDKPRIIHFVANAGNVSFQANELAVLSQLTKGNNQDAYWQRAIANSITGTLTANGTYTNVQAPGITDTDTTIKLVRNFARITLSAALNSGFNLAGFVLVNTATKGTVAPYMRQATDGNYFPNYDTENGSAMTKYEALFKAGYKGVQPADATIDGTVPDATSSLYTIDAKYLYERTQEKDPVFIIAKRDMGNGNYRYYKIDIMKVGGTGEVDDYYKILRNFSYDITIHSVEGGGYEDPETAAANVAANNLTASLELKDLTNISYGNERLFVSKTEIVWTSSDPITFKYKYEMDGSGSNATVSSLILGEAKNSSGAVCNENSYTISSGTTDAEGYSIISITHTGLPASGYKEQEVTIKAGTLMRSVNLILINPYQSTVGCDDQSGLNTVPTVAPEIPLTVGEEVYVYFSMPAGLPESIFPLTFILAPEAHSITPNGVNMPVVSLLNHENSTMQGLKYGFEKVVTWDEYKDSEQTGMIVECPFKTSLAESATNIYVYNEYFNFPLSTYFMNPREFKNLALDNANRYGEEQEVTINFNMNSLDPVTITVTEGTNTTTITHTPTNMGNQSVTYTTKTWNSQISVSLAADGYDSVSASGVTRNKYVIPSAKSKTINMNGAERTIYVSTSSRFDTSGFSFTSTEGSEIGEDLVLTINSLNQNNLNSTQIYFYYEGRVNNRNRQYKANLTIQQLLDGENLNFNQI